MLMLLIGISIITIFLSLNANSTYLETKIPVALNWSNSSELNYELSIKYFLPSQGVPIRRLLFLLPGGPGNSFDSDFKKENNTFALAKLAKKNTLVVCYSPRGNNSLFYLEKNKIGDAYNPVDFSLDQQVNDIIKIKKYFYDHIPEIREFWLLGFSHGGVVAAKTVTMFPHEIDGVILLGPSLGVDTPAWRIKSWLTQNPKIKTNMKKLIIKAKDGKLRVREKQISANQIQAAVVFSFYIGVPLSIELKKISRANIGEALANWNSLNEGAFILPFLSFLERKKSLINQTLADLIYCNELSGSCDGEQSNLKYEIPLQTKFSAMSNISIQKFTMPTLIIHGKDDQSTETLERLKQFIHLIPSKAKEIHTLENIGHSVHIENTSKVEKIILNFWK